MTEREQWEAYKSQYEGEKEHVWDFSKEPDAGHFRVEIVHNGTWFDDGFKEIRRHISVDYVELNEKLENSEIESFKVMMED